YAQDQLARRIRHMLSNREQGARSGQPLQSSGEKSSVAPGWRILVVEDLPEALQTTCDMVTALGGIAAGATHPEQALQRLEQESFDVLIADYTLPGMNGLEMAKRAKRRHPALKII